jgi:hypothetical protein
MSLRGRWLAILADVSGVTGRRMGRTGQKCEACRPYRTVIPERQEHVLMPVSKENLLFFLLDRSLHVRIAMVMHWPEELLS